MNKTEIIVNRMKTDVLNMQQKNEEMIALKRGKYKIYEELETSIKTCNAIIKELKEIAEREVS